MHRKSGFYTCSGDHGYCRKLEVEEFDLFNYLRCHKMYGKSELNMMYVINTPLTTFLQGVSSFW
jgi:hypothetical protein